jgi:hypothetical protein
MNSAAADSSSIYGITLEKHKDHLIYGAAFLFWGVIAYVEVGAYFHQIAQFAMTLTLMSSLFTILIIGSQQEKFRPDLLLKIDALKVRFIKRHPLCCRMIGDTSL